MHASCLMRNQQGESYANRQAADLLAMTNAER